MATAILPTLTPSHLKIENIILATADFRLHINSTPMTNGGTLRYFEVAARTDLLRQICSIGLINSNFRSDFEDWEIGHGSIVDSRDPSEEDIERFAQTLRKLSRSDFPAIGERLRWWNRRSESGKGENFKCYVDPENQRYNAWWYSPASYFVEGDLRDSVQEDVPILSQEGNLLSNSLIDWGWQVLLPKQGHTRTAAVPPQDWRCEQSPDLSCGWTKWFDRLDVLRFQWFWKAYHGRVLECFGVVL